jgi:CBS domain-containing protein
MMSEPDREVAEFIEQSIRSLEAGGHERKFDERMLQAPVGVLQPRPPILVEPQAPILEAVALMQERKVGCVLVVRAGKLKGIFTERDVLTGVVGRGVDPTKTPVRKLMTPNPEYLRITDPIAHALNKMSIGGYRHVPIVDKALTPVGVVSVGEIVTYLVRFFPESILNLPTFPRGNYAREREGA